MTRRGLWLCLLLATAYGLATLCLTTSFAVAQEQREPVRTECQRVDHFWWYVRDTEALRPFFRDTLGFTISADVRYPAGSRATFIWFEDDSFFEVLTPERQPPDVLAAVRTFLSRHEGAWKMGMRVAATEPVAHALKERGFEVGHGAGTWESLGGRTGLPDVMWTGVDLREAPGHLVFFWQFTPGWDEMRRRMPELDPTAPERTSHPNTALGLRTPWVAVWDVDRSVRDFSRLELEVGSEFELPHLQAVGREVRLSQGTILLLEPTSYASPVQHHLLLRGESVMGVSIEVSDLAKARQIIERGTGKSFEPYRGHEGRSILVPAALAHGVYLEFFQPMEEMGSGEGRPDG